MLWDQFLECNWVETISSHNKIFYLSKIMAKMIRRNISSILVVSLPLKGNYGIRIQDHRSRSIGNPKLFKQISHTIWNNKHLINFKLVILIQVWKRKFPSFTLFIVSCSGSKRHSTAAKRFCAGAELDSVLAAYVCGLSH